MGDRHITRAWSGLAITVPFTVVTWASRSSAALASFFMTMKQPSTHKVGFLFVLVLIAFCSCSKSKSSVSSLKVNLCDLYENPADYEGKSVTVSAAVTQLSGGVYLIPTTSCVSGFRFVKLDSSSIQSTDLKELETSSVSSSGRKEFEADVTGIFDSKYAENDDGFRFRIAASEIKQRSSVRSGRPLGAG